MELCRCATPPRDTTHGKQDNGFGALEQLVCKQVRNPSGFCKGYHRNYEPLARALIEQALLPLITRSRIKRKVCERDQSSHNDSDAALLKCHDPARQTNYAENAFQCAAGNADLDPATWRTGSVDASAYPNAIVAKTHPTFDHVIHRCRQIAKVKCGFNLSRRHNQMMRAKTTRPRQA